MCDIQQMIQKIVFIDGKVNFRGSALKWFYNTNIYTYEEFVTLRNVIDAVNSPPIPPMKIYYNYAKLVTYSILVIICSYISQECHPSCNIAGY